LVQSQGMARWLALQSAASQGISANFDYSFPAAFIWRLSKILDGKDSPGPYDHDSLVWAILANIDAQLEKPPFADLKKYLSGDCRPLRTYQLAQKIADLFDQYMVFRPDWIMEWTSGEADHWQAILWRALLAAFDDNHRVKMLARLLERMDISLVKAAKLPTRISIFGVSALPPSLFMVFAKLAEFIEVHCFMLNPCQAYWTDLLSEAEHTRISLNSMSKLDLVSDLHYETGNSLLLNFGKMGRDFQQVLHHYDYEEFEYFEEIYPVNALTVLQAAILNGTEVPESASIYLSEEDSSVQVHAAHSPMREVEVLYNNLLAMFNSDQDLNPDDILVMVPDISLYAPLIEAVFSTPEHEEQKVPFIIADRGPGLTQELVRAFLELLSIAGSRMNASTVLDFLAREPVRCSFAIQEEDIDSIRGWLDESAIFWGMDEKHRQELGLPAENAGTWQAGLDRLLLGYAMPVNESFFLDILPCDLVEGSSAKLLGKFLHFYQCLTRFMTRTRGQMELSEWGKVLVEFLDIFLVNSGGQGSGQSISFSSFEREKQTIRTAISDMVKHSVPAGFEQEIPFEIVKSALDGELGRPGGHSDFLSGRVTFCQMVPMRSIPFKVISILGMNDGAFPRLDRPVGFDLMTTSFRIGDRCRRDDDRYLFLESIISARQVLYISYVGIGARDNEIFPSSVVVSELLANLGQQFGLDEKEASQRFTVFHPLQPFSAKYFSGAKRLNNFSSLNREVAGRLTKSMPYPGFFSGIVKGDEEFTVTVDDFVSFFEHPVRYLLRNRLGIYLLDSHKVIKDRECFSLDGLGNYKLLEKLLSMGLAEEKIDSDLLARIFQTKAVVPVGTAGRYTFNEAEEEIISLVSPLLEQFGGAPLEPLKIDLDLGRVKVVGHLRNLWPSGQYLVRPTKIDNINYRDSIRFWFFHLFLNAVTDGDPTHTFFVGRNGQKSYSAVSDAVSELKQLAELFVAGMFSPLPLLPKATMHFAKMNWQTKKDSDPQELVDAGLIAAKKIWQEGDFFSGPEKTEPYLWTAFGDSSPFAGLPGAEFGFVDIAEIILKKAMLYRE